MLYCSSLKSDTSSSILDSIPHLAIVYHIIDISMVTIVDVLRSSMYHNAIKNDNESLVPYCVVQYIFTFYSCRFEPITILHEFSLSLRLNCKSSMSCTCSVIIDYANWLSTPLCTFSRFVVCMNCLFRLIISCIFFVVSSVNAMSSLWVVFSRLHAIVYGTTGPFFSQELSPCRIKNSF